VADEIFDFAWTFTESGYHVLQGQVRPSGLVDPAAKSQPFIADGIALGEPRVYTRYNPLIRYPGLFLEFSRLQPTESDVIGFADRFGLLVGETIFGTDRPSLGIPGDPLAFWKEQIRVMRETVSLWMLQKQGRPELAEFIRWQKGRVIYTGPLGGRTLAASYRRPEWLKRWRQGETRGPALTMIQSVINDQIFTQVGARLLWNQAGTAMDVYFVPRNLLGAMWLQFARAFIRQKKYRPCQVCGRIMEISTDPHSQARKRADALICGDKCRSQKGRDKKKAISLWQQGQSLGQIRKRLVGNYPLATLDEWVH
jgi:hypothetical protein